MSLAITSPVLEATYTSFNLFFQRGLTRNEAWASRVATVIPSSTGSNTYAWLKNIGGFREWVGERQFEELVSKATVLANKDYEKSLKVPRNAIEDEQLGIWAAMFEMMGVEAMKWPDQVLAGIIKGGTSNLAFDGQPFFHNSHPVDMDDPSKGTYSNLLTGTPLTPDNYGAARSLFRSRVNSAGQPMSLKPDLLVVPPQLEDMATRILTTDIIARAVGGAAATDANIYKGTAQPLVIEELSDQPDAWYLLCTKLPIRPFIWQLRKAPQMFPLDQPTDSNVLMNKEYRYLGDSRGAGGYSFPFLGLRGQA